MTRVMFSPAALAALICLLVTALAPASLFAAGLGEYKDQKHAEQGKKVTKDSCQQDYIARCMDRCAASAARSCAQTCEDAAPNFCAKRTKRRRRKQAETVAKGASVGAGAAAVIIANRMPKEEGEGKAGPLDPYAIIWKSGDLMLNAGGGYLLGNTGIGTGSLRMRYGHFGISGQVSHMRSGSDYLTELDVGPTGYIHSRAISFGAQPSLLVSRGNGVDPLYGVGVRSFTDVYIERFVLNFDPMLGYINRQWNYHLRVGATYRITPLFQASLSYDFRDILNLNDLDISQSVLQGVVFQIGVRFN